jgi:hypothetical protein
MPTGSVLFVTHADVGHLNPLTVIMQRLRTEGCRVTCLMPNEDTLGAVRREALAGIDLRFCPTPSDAGRPNFEDEPSAIQWARDVFEATRHAVPALREAIRACAADFVVIDPFVRTAAALAATHLEGLPYGLLWSNLLSVAPNRLRTRYLQEAAKAFQGVIEPLGVGWSADFGSPRSRLNIALVVPELIGGDVPGVHLVGFPNPPERRGDEVEFDWSKVPESPFVYVSFGSYLERPDLLDVVFRATKRLGLRVVASAGALVDRLGDCGDHVTLCRYVPQREVLRRASVFVTHGGYNSVTEALRAGTPMLVLPVAVDQPIQAHYVSECGAGRALALSELTEESAAEALAALTAPDNSYRTHAQRLARLAANGDATTTAANLILAAMKPLH